MAGRFSVEAVFKAIDRVTAPVNRMQNRVGQFTRGMNRGFTRLNRTVDNFAGGVKKAAIASAAALAISGAAMANVIGTGAEFEQTLVSAAAKFPGEIRKGTEAFTALEDAAKKTGATTEFTASQSAQALNFLAMAGFSAEASIAALPGVVDLATAAQVDLATATDVASDTLGAFGLATKDVTQLGKNLARVNDVIAKTTTTANTTVESLFETIKDGAPVATTAGASIETFAALAGELANSGIKGSRAGTTLKNMFLSLAAPGSGAAKILKRLGVSTKDSSGNMRDIVDILGDLNGSLDGLGTADRSGVLEGIFGKIPIAGVNVLLASGTTRLKEYRKELEGASGASSKMASVMRDTLQGRLNSLNSAIEGVKISIFGMTSGPLSDAVDKMTAWVRVNEQMLATNIGEFLAGIINNFKNIVTWTVRIAKGLAAFFALVAVLKSVALILTVVNLLATANPIGLMVLGIVAAIALLGALAAVVVANWEPIKQFFADLWGGVVEIFDDSVAKILSIVDKVKAPVVAVNDLLSGVGSSIGGGVFDAVQGAKSFFGIGGDAEASTRRPAPQVVSPQDRVARSIDEQRTTSSAEVTIRDETGRAQVTGGRLGTGLQLQSTGAF